MWFIHALQTGKVLLADGGLGSALIAAGLPTESPPESWTLSRPDLVSSIHRAFVEADADILLTNTFGANLTRLSTTGTEALHDQLNMEAVNLARAAAAHATTPVAIAGSVGPLTGTGTENDVSVYAQQIAQLEKGGVDLIWIETMIDPNETRSALRAAAASSLPFVITGSFHAGAKLTPMMLMDIVSESTRRPLAIGVNCGDGPEQAIAAVSQMASARPDLPLIFKPNAGLPTRDGSLIHYPETPESMHAWAHQAVALGARIIGGCCGTTAARLSRMTEVVRKP